MRKIDRKTLPVLVIILIIISCSVPRSTTDFTKNSSRKSAPDSEERNSVNDVDNWLVEENEIVADEEKVDRRLNDVVKRPSTTDNKDVETTVSRENYARNTLIKRAKTHLGASYKYGGNGPSRFDCSGFTRYCMREVGVELSRTSGYQARQGKKISIKKARKGDLIFFGRRRNIQHVGIIAKRTSESLLVIHASSSRGVIIEDVLESPYWKPRILYATNVIGTAELNIAKFGK